MRATKFFILLALLFSTLPVMAQSTYKLRAGDAVEIWMAQYTDLTREVTLAPDGWISLPLAGALNAEGMTLEVLQSALIERLQPFFNSDVSLNVSLVPREEHALTFFVSGDVENPGEYSFRPGLTVLHAVSIAGGLYRSAVTTADRDRSLEVGSLLANGEKRLTELDVIIARLNAEMANEDDFELPDGLDPAAASGFVRREQAMLRMQRSNMQSQKDSLARLVAINEDNVAAINAQIASIEDRIALSQERLEATSTLAERGVIQPSQVREIEVNIVEMEGSISVLRSSLATQQAAIITEQSRVNSLEQELQVNLVTQLSAAQNERERLLSDVTNYRETISLYEPTAVMETVLGYEIVRASAGSSINVDATEQTVLLAGDIVRVITNAPIAPPTPPAVDAETPTNATTSSDDAPS